MTTLNKHFIIRANKQTHKKEGETMKQDKTLKTISITLDNIITQLDILDDVISEICQEKQELTTYSKLFDYVFSSVIDINEKIKTL